MTRSISSGSGHHQTRDGAATAELPLAFTIDRDSISVRSTLRDLDFTLLYFGLTALLCLLMCLLILSRRSCTVARFL